MAKKKQDDTDALVNTQQTSPPLAGSTTPPFEESFLAELAPVEPASLPERRGGEEPVPVYDGHDLTGFCIDFDVPVRLFLIGRVSGRLSLGTAFGFLEAALEEASGIVLGPLAGGTAAPVIVELRGFLRSGRGSVPRYLQMLFDAGPPGECLHLSKVEIRRFVDDCRSVLNGLVKAADGERVAATSLGFSSVQATYLTDVDPSWQLYPVLSLKTDKPILVPLLSESRMPPPLAYGRPITVARRIDFPALENRTLELDKELAELQRPVILRYQEFLDQLVGEACPSAEDNSKLVKLVNSQAAHFGMALLYEADGCGCKQVRLKYSSGVFVAWTPGRAGEQVYSGAGFPPLRVAHRAGASTAPAISDRPQS